MVEKSQEPNSQAIAKTLYTVDHDGEQAAEEGDELPTGYRSVQGEYASLSVGKLKA
jgi:hypothetical protein